LDNDVTYVQWLLGHSELKTTSVYLKYDKEFIKKHLKLFVHPLSKNQGGKDKKGTGDIAQLGEHLNGIQEVSGSIPLISTFYKIIIWRNFCDRNDKNKR
tara:strand:- start:433 stop:729 length:297 start_codon:yes stop_codon:yes gene_type:complete